jgi:hypothetical protein
MLFIILSIKKNRNHHKTRKKADGILGAGNRTSFEKGHCLIGFHIFRNFAELLGVPSTDYW